MSRIEWNASGFRFFETGVDRGVLYLKNAPGVPWNGLTSVSESSSGGEPTAYYIDGIKYLNLPPDSEFEATIEAFTYPEEFAVCDGSIDVGNGLFITNQRRAPFDLSYRTLIGNDLHGMEHGYKIHLVYNATASPAGAQSNTLGEEIDPTNFSWDISTKPSVVEGRKPTSHFVIDSRGTPPDLLQTIEDILYGSATSQPRIPSVEELVFLFEGYQSSVFDAGGILDEYFLEFDAGVLPTPFTSTIDGGGP